MPNIYHLALVDRRRRRHARRQMEERNSCPRSTKNVEGPGRVLDGTESTSNGKNSSVKAVNKGREEVLPGEGLKNKCKKSSLAVHGEQRKSTFEESDSPEKKTPGSSKLEANAPLSLEGNRRENVRETFSPSLDDSNSLRNFEDPTMPEPNAEQEPEDVEDLTLDLEEPSPEVMEYARRELGETDEVRCLTLQELRDMIYERGECLPHRMDDAFLIRFLRARNFNVNRTHRLIVNYCNFKEEHPEIHQDVNPLEMRHIGDDDVMTVPAYRTQCGRRMMIYRMGNWDPKKYSIEELFKATVIILELGILEPRAQVLGGVVIFDLEGLTMAHAWTVTPQVASMVLSLMVSAFPMKSHAIHILHQSWIFDAIFTVFKPLMDARMRSKIFFHGDDMTSLHKHVVPTSLPRKYGGTRDELPYYKWIDSLSHNPRIVKEMHQLGYVVSEETLRNISAGK